MTAMTDEEARDAYAGKLRELLALVQPKRLEQGVCLLLGRAERIAAAEQISLEAACRRVYEEASRRTYKRLEKMRCAVGRPVAPDPQPQGQGPR